MITHMKVMVLGAVERWGASNLSQMLAYLLSGFERDDDCSAASAQAVFSVSRNGVATEYRLTALMINPQTGEPPIVVVAESAVELAVFIRATAPTLSLELPGVLDVLHTDRDEPVDDCGCGPCNRLRN